MRPLFFLLACMSAQSGGTAEQTLEGLWSNPNGTVVILIDNCGEALCGHVQWASDKAAADARRGGTDPLVGVQVLSDIVPKGAGRWSATLFVADLNRRSKAVIRQLGNDRLKVTGCAVGRLVCKSQVWTRTDAD